MNLGFVTNVHTLKIMSTRPKARGQLSFTGIDPNVERKGGFILRITSPEVKDQTGIVSARIVDDKKFRKKLLAGAGVMTRRGTLVKAFSRSK